MDTKPTPGDTSVDDESIRQETMAIMGKYQELLVGGQLDEWIELWAEGGVCEFPYAGSGQARRLVGHAEILDYMKSIQGEIEIDEVTSMTVHSCVDPTTVVLEVSARGRAVKTGKPYHQSYVIVAQTEAGKLQNYREYWNPVVIAEANES